MNYKIRLTIVQRVGYLVTMSLLFVGSVSLAGQDSKEGEAASAAVLTVVPQIDQAAPSSYKTATFGMG